MDSFLGRYFYYAHCFPGKNATVNDKPLVMSGRSPKMACYQEVNLSIDGAVNIVNNTKEYNGIHGVYETDEFYLITLKGMDSEFFKNACNI